MKSLEDEQKEYYKRENDVAKWTAIIFFGVPLAGIILIGLAFLFSK